MLNSQFINLDLDRRDANRILRALESRVRYLESRTDTDPDKAARNNGEVLYCRRLLEKLNAGLAE